MDKIKYLIILILFFSLINMSPTNASRECKLSISGCYLSGTGCGGGSCDSDSYPTDCDFVISLNACQEDGHCISCDDYCKNLGADYGACDNNDRARCDIKVKDKDGPGNCNCYNITGLVDCDPTINGILCVNTSTDPNNCGFCGNNCSTGEVCVNGVCTLPKTCKSYDGTNRSACEGFSSNCKWCPKCNSEHKTISGGGIGKCINKSAGNSCPSYSCSSGDCGAHCNSDPGNKTVGTTCYYGTCCSEIGSLSDKCSGHIRYVNGTCTNTGPVFDTSKCNDLPYVLSASCGISGSNAICKNLNCNTCYKDADGDWTNGCEENICTNFKGFFIWTPSNSNFKKASDVCNYSSSIQYIAKRENYYSNETEKWEANYTIYSCHYTEYPFNNSFDLKEGKGYLVYSEKEVGFQSKVLSFSSIDLTPGINFVGWPQSSSSNINTHITGNYNWICGK